MSKIRAYEMEKFFLNFSPPGPPQKIKTKNDEVTRRMITSSAIKNLVHSNVIFEKTTSITFKKNVFQETRKTCDSKNEITSTWEAFKYFFWKINVKLEFFKKMKYLSRFQTQNFWTNCFFKFR